MIREFISNILSRKKIIWTSCLAVSGIFVIGGISYVTKEQKFSNDYTKTESVSVSENLPFEYMQVPLHDWELSYRVPQKNEQFQNIEDKRVFGGIVPHHLVSQTFIAGMFSLLAESRDIPKTVIILSPNHEEAGDAFVQTANMVWKTPDGLVGTDVAKAKEVSDIFGAPFQGEAMKHEHGVYNIIPFVKHFLPQAKVVPITLRFATPVDDQDRLVGLLSKWLEQKDVVVIASIDFSHYLSSAEANQKDGETYNAMKRYDYKEISSYQSDHLDTPTGLMILLRTMQSLNATHQTVLGYDNSGEVLDKPFTETTSHFLISFTQQE